jgi:lipopolysaccharide export system permease protein
VSQLVRLSEMLVMFGISFENVFLPFLFIILPFVHMAIPMAYLFAVVLSYARLSADGEYAALLAAGYSLKRAAVPTLIVAAVLYVFATFAAMHFESWGRRELTQFFYRKTQTELDNMIKYKMQPGVFLDDFLDYTLYAERISSDRTRLENVLIAPGNDNKEGSFTLLAPSGSISGSVEGGDLKLVLEYGVAYATRSADEGSSVLKFKRAEIDLIRIFQEKILGPDAADDDFRSYTPSDLRKFIDELAANPKRDEAVFRRASYLFHQRVSSPFAVISFALFGMVLGISDPRRGKSMAYLGAILTIIGGYVLKTGCDWLANNRSMDVMIAAWLPNVILCAAGAFLVYQKHRLPPSESTLALENLPLLNRLARRRR